MRQPARPRAVLMLLCAAALPSCRVEEVFPQRGAGEPIAAPTPARPPGSGAALGGDASVPSPDSEFSRARLLEAFAECTVSGLWGFVERAAELEAATEAYAADPQSDSREQARIAWEAAMDEWQRLELFQFGPAAMSQQPGGQELRASIYSWPQFNRCLVEQVLVAGVYETDLADQFASARGLDTLEYLLFYEGNDNACPSGTSINSTGTWDALVTEGLEPAKAAYARAAAVDVRQHAEELLSAWEKPPTLFRDELARAGRGSTIYPTNQAGLNAVSDALFYLDTETKDMKLGGPLGIVPCGTTCTVEASFSGRSKINVRNNLVGFRMLYSGCGGARDFGFDDLLVNEGQGALAADIAGALDAADGAVDRIAEPTLGSALMTEADDVRALHTAVKALTDLLKADFVTVLNLDLPAGAEGDND